MALFSEPGGMRIRTGGREFVLTEQMFLDRSQMPDAALERALEALVEAGLTDRSAHIHIRSRSPLDYIIKVAAAGHVPDADWWVPRANP